jgi:hypothetical protein
MRFTAPLFVTAVLLFVVSCAATESTAEPEERETIETEYVERVAPAWFDSGVNSVMEDAEFHGFSHAIGNDRAEASGLSREMALANLRFEIDRYAEHVRSWLEEEAGSNPYASSRFIISLRNAIQDMDLSGLDDETEFHEDGAVDSFTRVMISLDEAADKLAGQLNDSQFIEAFRNHASD